MVADSASRASLAVLAAVAALGVAALFQAYVPTQAHTHAQNSATPPGVSTTLRLHAPDLYAHYDDGAWRPITLVGSERREGAAVSYTAEFQVREWETPDSATRTPVMRKDITYNRDAGESEGLIVRQGELVGGGQERAPHFLFMCENDRFDQVYDELVGDGAIRRATTWTMQVHCKNAHRRTRSKDAANLMSARIGVQYHSLGALQPFECAKRDCAQTCPCELNVDLPDWSLRSSYTHQMCHYIRNGLKCPKRVLEIGLGMSFMVQCVMEHCGKRWGRQKNSKRTPRYVSVELHAAVVDGARQYFGLRPPEEYARLHGAQHEVVVADALEFLQGNGSTAAAGGEKFDLVMVDCFAGGAPSVPAACASDEFYSAVKRAMQSGKRATFAQNAGDAKVLGRELDAGPHKLRSMGGREIPQAQSVQWHTFA